MNLFPYKQTKTNQNYNQRLSHFIIKTPSLNVKNLIPETNWHSIFQRLSKKLNKEHLYENFTESNMLRQCKTQRGREKPKQQKFILRKSPVKRITRNKKKNGISYYFYKVSKKRGSVNIIKQKCIHKINILYPFLKETKLNKKSIGKLQKSPLCLESIKLKDESDKAKKDMDKRIYVKSRSKDFNKGKLGGFRMIANRDEIAYYQFIFDLMDVTKMKKTCNSMKQLSVMFDGKIKSKFRCLDWNTGENKANSIVIEDKDKFAYRKVTTISNKVPRKNPRLDQYGLNNTVNEQSFRSYMHILPNSILKSYKPGKSISCKNKDRKTWKKSKYNIREVKPSTFKGKILKTAESIESETVSVTNSPLKSHIQGTPQSSLQKMKSIENYASPCLKLIKKISSKSLQKKEKIEINSYHKSKSPKQKEKLNLRDSVYFMMNSRLLSTSNLKSEGSSNYNKKNILLNSLNTNFQLINIVKTFKNKIQKNKEEKRNTIDLTLEKEKENVKKNKMIKYLIHQKMVNAFVKSKKNRLKTRTFIKKS